MFQQTVDRVVTLLRDPVFWIATVACGLLVTVIGNYVTRFADRLFASYRSQRRHRVDVSETSVQAAAQHLLQHPNERFDLKLDILFYSQKSILFSAWCIVLLATAIFMLGVIPSAIRRFMVPFTLLVGLLAWLVVGVYHLRELRARRILQAYHRLSNSKTYDDVLDEAIAKNK